MNIIPTIFAIDSNTAKNKYNLLSFSDQLHLDICDGKFVNTKTISLKEFQKLIISKKQTIEVHLMVQKPEDYFEDCKILNAKKVFIHIEIIKNQIYFKELKKKAKNLGLELALVSNPQTPVDYVFPYVNQIKSLMLMTVTPGAEGQQFKKEVMNVVKILKTMKPNLYIQVDGGGNEETVRSAKKSGVDSFAVGSYISSSENPEKNYRELKK